MAEIKNDDILSDVLLLLSMCVCVFMSKCLFLQHAWFPGINMTGVLLRFN